MTEATVVMRLTVKVKSPEGMNESEAKTAAIEAVMESIKIIDSKGYADQPITVEYENCSHSRFIPGDS